MLVRSLFSGKKDGKKGGKDSSSASSTSTTQTSSSSSSSKAKGSGRGRGKKGGQQQQKWEADIQPVNEDKVTLKTCPYTNVYMRGEKELGQGAFSKVFEATHRASKKRYAIKYVAKEESNEDSLKSVEAVRKEIEFLSNIKHPHIIRLYEVYETDTEIVLVLELMEGGELFERIVSKRFFTEEEARRALRMIASAVQHLHSHSVVHRDLKPENILYKSPNDDYLVLSDFGFAIDVPDGSSLTQPCGTLQYAAPEVLTARAYHKAVDMWGIGVIAYALLCGFPPFYTLPGEGDQELANKIAQAVFDFPSPWWDRVSASAKDLISRLLEKDPKIRLTAEQMLEHEWMVMTHTVTDDNSHDTDHAVLPIFHQNRNSTTFIDLINKSIVIRRVMDAPDVEDLKQKAWYTV